MVQLADTPELIRKAHQLRYQVYCRGNDSFNENSLEVDEFDSHSRHLILRDSITREVTGTVRLVLWQEANPEASFLVQRVIPAPLRHYVPLRTTAEVSRFAIFRKCGDLAGAEVRLLLLQLVQGLVCLSAELGITHWVALMESTLLDLLKASAIDFSPIGKPLDFHGLCQPCYLPINKLLARVYHERQEIWDLLTDGGTLWPARPNLPAKVLVARPRD
jgi:N-acyl-L-homoserine lactone synthetase